MSSTLRYRFNLLAVVAFCLCANFAPAQTTFPSETEIAQNWLAFRGHAAGIAAGNVPTDWDGPTGHNILWKTPVPLAGRNSPIVWGSSIFISGATKDRQEVFCFDADTGALKWQKTIGNPDPTKAPKVMEDAGFAASTMTTDGKRAFVIFATGDVAALDFAGEIVWSKKLGLPINQYGHASSLLMWQDRLIVQFDQGLDAKAGKSALIALDAASGNVVWKTARPVANSWTSPILITTPTGPQIITNANPFVIAYEPQNGTEIWRAKCLEGDVAPSVAYGNGLVCTVMENAVGSGIKTDGKGDVTKSHVAFEIDAELPDIVSPVATDKVLISVRTFGNVTCFDLADGKKLWNQDFDVPFHASPIVIGNVVHLIDQKGVMHRFEAAAEFKLLNKLTLGEPISATPAVVRNRMYLRGETNLYCVGTK